jgi:hypothetical protein
MDTIMTLLGAAWFLLVGICGIAYPFMVEHDEKKGFDKNNVKYRDGDNT